MMLATDLYLKHHLRPEGRNNVIDNNDVGCRPVPEMPGKS